MLRDVRKTFIPVVPNLAFMDPIAHEKSKTIFFQNYHKKSRLERRYQERATVFTLNGFPAGKHLLKENMGGKILENDDKKNVLQTCCGLSIYVPYWTSDSLFLWTSVRLAGFDRIHLTTILALHVQN